MLLRTKASGFGEIEILPSSLVLANDGKASNVLAEFKSSVFSISEERISRVEEEFQMNFLRTNVLGVTSEKMIFFEEDTESVAMESILEGSDTPQKENIRFWDLIHRIDTGIVNILTGVIGT